MPLIIEHVTIHYSKYAIMSHFFNNPTSIEEALDQNNTENIFKFFKYIDLIKKKIYNFINLNYNPYLYLKNLNIMFNNS